MIMTIVSIHFHVFPLELSPVALSKLIFFFIAGVFFFISCENVLLGQRIFFKKLSVGNELIFMLCLDRIYSKCINILEDIKAYFLLHKKIFLTWKFYCNLKEHKRSRRWCSKIWRNLNWKETKRSNHKK